MLTFCGIVLGALIVTFVFLPALLGILMLCLPILAIIGSIILADIDPDSHKNKK